MSGFMSHGWNRDPFLEGAGQSELTNLPSEVRGMLAYALSDVSKHPIAVISVLLVSAPPG